MNTIELMLKPLRTALEAVEALGLADDEYTVGLRAAIAAGEAELKREPDGWRVTVGDRTEILGHEAFYWSGLDEAGSGRLIQSVGKPMYLREETK